MISDIFLVGSMPMLRITVVDEESAIVELDVATERKIILTTPSGEKREKDATLFTDGKDGIMQYQCLPTDIDEQGTWKLEPRVVIAGKTYRGTGDLFYADD